MSRNIQVKREQLEAHENLLIELEKEKRNLESSWDKVLKKAEDVDNPEGLAANNCATNIEGDLADLEKEISETKEKIAELKH